MSSTCIRLEDVIELSQPDINEMGKVGSSLDESSDESCAMFRKKVELVEGIMKTVYRVAVTVAKRTSDLEEIANVWSIMRDFCESLIKTLSKLKEKFPHCGTPELHNLALDYRAECDKRRRGVLKEISCPTVTLPAGLFPEMS